MFQILMWNVGSSEIMNNWIPSPFVLGKKELVCDSRHRLSTLLIRCSQFKRRENKF